ncbi:MAG: hypothetical protein ACWA5T_05520 [Parvularcula sp.]
MTKPQDNRNRLFTALDRIESALPQSLATSDDQTDRRRLGARFDQLEARVDRLLVRLRRHSPPPHSDSR